MNGINTNGYNLYWIDLFCGAGGTSTGIHLAGSKVIACVNHDKNALAAHKANHPEAIHYEEDIRDFRVVQKLLKLISEIRAKDPLAIIAIWGSLECTNFSKAKGGLPRDADSRTLAEHMEIYVDVLRPEYLWIENVREFMAWGPLNDKGKPISTRNGAYFIRWLNAIQNKGYRQDHQLLNAADFGSYQARERLFIQFATGEFPMAWPEQTHTKDPSAKKSLFPMDKHKAVKEILELDNEGQSIFDRKKNLSENTLKRIYAGLVKFVANGEDMFRTQYNGGKKNPHHRAISLNQPCGTVLSNGTHALVKTCFIKKYFSGKPEGKVIGVDQPAGTVCTVDHQALVQAIHLSTYNGNTVLRSIEEVSPVVPTKDRISKIHVKFIDQQYGKSTPSSVEQPCNTLTINPKFALVNIKHEQYIMNQYSGGGETTDIDGPAASVTTVPKHNLVSTKKWLSTTSYAGDNKSIDDPCPPILASRRHHYILNPSWFGHATGVDQPCITVVARQDKAPISIVSVSTGDIITFVYDDDCETMIKIKYFMVAYGITDIKMRMLNIMELKQIQGFPKEYVLIGTQTDQKKQIGNAVDVTQAKALVTAKMKALNEYKKVNAA